MNRRALLAALGVVALVLVGLASPTVWTALAQEGEKHGQADKTAKACADCNVQCAKALRHCIHQLAAGKKEYAKCALLCLDCTQMCGACAACCHGPSAGTACDSCAKVCDHCAEACEKLHDTNLNACAKSCRHCAKMCREMSKHAAHGD